MSLIEIDHSELVWDTSPILNIGFISMEHDQLVGGNGGGPSPEQLLAQLGPDTMGCRSLRKTNSTLMFINMAREAGLHPEEIQAALCIPVCNAETYDDFESSRFHIEIGRQPIWPKDEGPMFCAPEDPKGVPTGKHPKPKNKGPRPGRWS